MVHRNMYLDKIVSLGLGNIEKLSELWKNPEWRKLSKAFTKDKNCSWCGLYEGDKYIDSRNRTKKTILAPHHIEKHKWGLKLYKQVQNRLFKEWYNKNKDKDFYKNYPSGLNNREKRKYIKFQWIKDNRGLLKEEFDKAKKEIIRAYIDLNEDEIIVLCNRCHFQRENGYVLCTVCKKKYHQIKYVTCYNCKELL